jgi:PKD repeat protein
LTSTYDWDFGDKGRGTGAVTRHTYTNPATYRATVIYTRFDNPQLRQQATNTVLVIVTNRPTVVTNRVPVVTNPPAILQVDPKTLLFNGKVRGTDPAPLMLDISNRGGRPLRWTLFAPAAPWLKVNPTTGSLPVGQGTRIQVAVTSSRLAAGSYETQLTITSPEAANGTQLSTIVLRIIPSQSTWLRPAAFTGSGLVALAGLLLVVRKTKGRSKRQTPEIHLRVIPDPGSQRVKVHGSLLAPKIGLRIIPGEGTVRVKAPNGLIKKGK